MKRHLIYILAASTLLLTSCLDYDNPGDEFSSSQKVTDDTVNHGNPASINPDNYAQSLESFKAATSAMDTDLKGMASAQYSLRGGKEGNLPGSHAYQRQYTLGPDNYAQYSTIPHHDFMYGEQTSTYYVSPDFNPGPNSSFVMVKNFIVPLLHNPSVDSIPEMKAMALLIHDIAAQEVADLYGPFPYSDYLDNKQVHPFTYNDLETIYMSIGQHIDTIVNCFKAFDEKPDWYKKEVRTLRNKHVKITQDSDNGVSNFDTWIRMANSLRLRMAMHMVKVKPELARQWAEKAVEEGVIENPMHEAALSCMNLGLTHPLMEISGSWHDCRLSASFCSILQSLNHPYLGFLFTKNQQVLHNVSTGEAMVADSEYVGLREGTHTGEGQAYANNEYIGFSELDQNEFLALAPLYVFKLSELCFLRAEGALRGWNMGGTAQYFYEMGIEYADFADRLMADGNPYSEQLSDYMNQESARDYTWKDPIGKDIDMPSVTKIGVKWNDGDTEEVKLEKIITQKYIALWPNSFEAWGDMRRTGYPRVFPVLNPDDGDGSLYYGDLIRRMPFPGSSEAEKADIQSTGLSALGGYDEQATRLWWDVE